MATASSTLSYSRSYSSKRTLTRTISTPGIISSSVSVSVSPRTSSTHTVDLSNQRVTVTLRDAPYTSRDTETYEADLVREEYADSNGPGGIDRYNCWFSDGSTGFYNYGCPSFVSETITYYSFSYRVTITYTVLTAPNTPTSIAIPGEIKGGESIQVSWGSSTRATRYHLERSINGGAFTQIYSGSSRSYTDSITKGWQTVAYRVRGYNTEGYSSYRTSATRDIKNFLEMGLKVNGTLKQGEQGWVKVNGQLKELSEFKARIDGNLREL